MLEESLSCQELDRIAQGYDAIAKTTRERLTVSQFGLIELHGLLQLGYRVLVKPRRTLGFESEDGRGCDCKFCRVGMGKHTILPNRIGEILTLDISTSGTYSPYVDEMVWFTGGTEEKNITMRIEGEDRFNDLLVFGFIPPKKRDIELVFPRRYDPKQKLLFSLS